MIDPLNALIIAAILSAISGWLFWPEKGLFWRWQQARQVTRRVLREDALKHIHDCEYHNRRPTVKSLAGSLRITVNEATELLSEMQDHELITFEGDQVKLSPQGRDYALHIIRAHRLWERYLADKTGYPEADWHSKSEHYEHLLTPADAEALADELGHPRYDPHGDPIPTAAGELAAVERLTLPNFPLDQPGRITHLEDEPEAVYAQLVAEGLHPGISIRVVEATPQRIVFWANGDEHILAPIIAANISVDAFPAEEAPEPIPHDHLNNLKPKESARVIGISKAIRGAERRRLMDLGILPGTVITAELRSPAGELTAYQVRGALIGLRDEQAALIDIEQERL